MAKKTSTHLFDKFSKFKETYGLSDSEMQDYATKITSGRFQSYDKALMKKYGKDLMGKVLKYYGELPARIRNNLSFEEVIFRFGKENPKELKLKDYEKFLGRDGKPKSLIRDERYDDLPEPEWNEQKGEYVPKKKVKISQEAKVPSKEEVKRMSSSEIRKKILEISPESIQGGRE